MIKVLTYLFFMMLFKQLNSSFVNDSFGKSKPEIKQDK